MKEPNWASCSEEELWEYVGTKLAEGKIQSVLVGGAVVAIYSEGAYRSGDLDMVLEGYNIKYADIDHILNKIGFFRKGAKGYYEHPLCKHIFIELLQPPLAIGEDYSIIPGNRTVNGQIIKLLSPTDCIKDRLASYIYFKARECLDQAILVAKSQQYDDSAVEKWCKLENATSAYQDFKKSLAASK